MTKEQLQAKVKDILDFEFREAYIWGNTLNFETQRGFLSSVMFDKLQTLLGHQPMEVSIETEPSYGYGTNDQNFLVFEVELPTSFLTSEVD